MPTEETTYRGFIEKRLDKQDTTLDEILTQTKRTNGRVTQIEIDHKIDVAVRDAQNKMINRIVIAVIAVAAFAIGSVIVPIFSAYLSTR